MPSWGSSRCPCGGGCRGPHAPLSPAVNSARWICVTTALSSSATLTWGSSAPAPTTAQQGATQGWEMTAPPPSTPSLATTAAHRGSPSFPTPEKPMASAMLRHGRGLHPHPQGSCSEHSPQKGHAGNRALAVAPPDSTRVLWVPHPHLPPLSPHQGEMLPPYLFPRLQLRAGGHGRARVACGQEKMPSSTSCTEGWGAALA